MTTHGHSVTQTSKSTDKHSILETLKRLLKRRKSVASVEGYQQERSEEEPWPNSDDSEDADGHESGSSEVKSKPPNSIKRHRTRTPQYGDGGVPRDLEQDTLSSDSSDSLPEDKSWTRPTQETGPATCNSVGDHLFHLSCMFLAHLVYVSSAMYIKMMLHTSMYLLSFPLNFFLSPPNRGWSTMFQSHLRSLKINQILASPFMNHLDGRRWPLVCKCLQSHCMIQPQARSVCVK